MAGALMPQDVRCDGVQIGAMRKSQPGNNVMGRIAVMGRPPQVWDYWRPTGSGGGSGIVELGTVRGLDVALPVHFHREDQLTFVLAGRRRFVIAGDLREAGPGEGVHIPAGLPHRSLCGADEVVCINLYTPPGLYAAPEAIAGLARALAEDGRAGLARPDADRRGPPPPHRDRGGARIRVHGGRGVGQRRRGGPPRRDEPRGVFPPVPQAPRRPTPCLRASGAAERGAVAAPRRGAHRRGRGGHRIHRPEPSGALLPPRLRRDSGPLPGQLVH
ncbi:protein of unknown function (plasmid) [Azospirillum baldaniorum]|uniref:Cupin type-2 domain-containing protein n=1 Tax=Azospirillum baldaniorum TaxID=1064539 RepID=A0A9P1JVY1_9PROT|nr:protein of unknown function [Azospirillum baldaniorum]